jgi:Peptidase family M23
VNNATIQLKLDEAQFKKGLDGIAPAVTIVLGKVEVSAKAQMDKAGQASGLAFVSAATAAFANLKKITALIQPELDRATKAFRSGGEAGGKAFVSGFAGNLKGLVPALAIPDSAATSAGGAFGVAYTAGVMKNIAAQAIIGAMKAGNGAQEAGALAGGLFSRLYVATVLSSLNVPIGLSSAQQAASNGTAAGNAFAGNYAIAVAGAGTRIFAALAAQAWQAKTSGSVYGQAFSNGFESGSSAVYAALNKISATAQANAAVINQGIANSVQRAVGAIGTVASSAAGAVAANKYVAAFTGALSSLAGTVNSVIVSGLNATGAVAGAGAAAGGSFAAAFARMAAAVPGAMIGMQIGRSLAGGVQTAFQAGYNIGNWLKRGVVNIGRSIGQQIGSQIHFGIANAVVRAGGSLFDTKNIGEADRAASRVATIAKKPGEKQQYQRDAQAISRRLGYSILSKDVSSGQEEILSSNFSDRRVVNALATAGAKFSASSSGEADAAVTIKAVTRLANILRDRGLDGTGKTKLDVARDADALASILSGFQDASTGYREALVSSSIGKLLEPAAALRLNTYDSLGFAAVASNKLGPERVNAGVPGIFKNIKSPTKKALTVADNIGFDFSVQSLQDKGILGFFDELNKKLDIYALKHGKASKDANLAKLFGGVQSGSVASSVLENLGLVKESSDTIKNADINKKLAISQEGLIAKQTAFKNSLIELDIQIKQGLVGTLLTQAFSLAATAVKGLGDGLLKLNAWYVSLDSGTKGAVETIGQFAIVIGGSIATVVALGAAWAVLGGAFTTGAALAGTLALGIGQVLLAIAPIALPVIAVSAAVYGLAKAFGATDATAFTAAVTIAGVALAVVFGPAALAAIGTGVAAVVSGFVAIGTAAAAALIPLLPWIAAAAAVALALYGLKLAYEANKVAIDAWWRGVVAAVKPAWEAIKNFATQAGEFLRNLWDGTVEAATKTWDAIAKAVAPAWNAIKNFGRAIVDFLSPVIAFTGNFLGASFNVAAALIGKAIESILVAFTNTFLVIKDLVKGLIGFFGLLWNGAKFAFDAIGNALGKLGQWFGRESIAIGQSLKAIREKFPLIDSAIKATGVVLQWFADLGTGLMKGLGDLIKGIGDAFNALPNAINRTAEAINKIKFPTWGDTQFNRSPQAPITSGAPAPSRSGQIKETFGPQQPITPGVSPKPAGAGSSYGSLGGNGVEVAADGDLSGLGLGKLLGDKLARNPIRTGTITVNASQYKPGAGGIDGPEKDARGRRLTDQDKAVAIPGLHLDDGLPYGTIVRVTNPLTGKSTQATVRDTGPLAPGRELDITGAVARAIDFKGLGTLQVEVVSLPKGADPSKTYYLGRATNFNARNNDWTKTVQPGTAIKIRENVAQGFTQRVAEPQSSPFVSLQSPVGGLSYEQLLNYQPRGGGLPGLAASQKFDAARRGRNSGHQGVDYDKDVTGGLGDPVYAPFAGTASASRNARWGTTVTITAAINGKKYEARNLHLDDATYASYQGQPRQVVTGERIGTVGRYGQVDGFGRPTGNSPHLHLEGRIDSALRSNQDFFRQAKQDAAIQNSRISGGSGYTAGYTAPDINYDKQIAAARKLRQAQEDLAAAEKKLSIVQAEGARASSTAAKAAYVRRVAAAEESVRKKKQRVETAQSRVTEVGEPKAATPDERRSAEVSNVEAIYRSIQSRYSLENKRLENSGQSAVAIEAQKADNLARQASEITALRSQVDALRQIYGGTRDGQVAIDSLSATIEDAIKTSRDAADGVVVTTTAGYKKKVDDIIANNASDRESLDNRVKLGGPGAPTANQAELQRSLVIDAGTVKKLEAIAQDLIRYRNANSGDATLVKDIDAELARIDRFRAEAESTNRNTQSDSITKEIAVIVEKRNNEIANINYRRSVGDIDTDLEAQVRIALAWRRSSTELDKLIPLVERYRNLWSGDAQANEKANAIQAQLLVIETESRNLQRAAELASSNNAVAETQKKLETTTTTGDDKQRAIRYQQGLGKIGDEDAERAILEIRKETAIETNKLLLDMVALRQVQSDRTVLAAIDEQISKYRQISEGVDIASFAYKKAQQESSVLGATSKTLATDLDGAFRAVFANAFTGFKGLGGLLDTLLNKIADMGINAIFDAVGGSKKSGGGFLGPIGKLFGFSVGGEIKNYATGGGIGTAIAPAIRLASAYSAAMRKEGPGAVPIVAKVGEEVLSIPNAKLYRTLQRSGEWANLDRIYNYANAGTITAAGATSSSSTTYAPRANNSATGGTIKLEIETRTYGGVEYATIDQLKESVALAVKASEAKVSQNLGSTAYRNQYQIRG